jgi:hypothetical protein
MRVATLIRYVPGIYNLFKEAVRAAMDEVDEPTREVAERLLHDVLAALADARAAAPAPESGTAVEPPASGDRPRRS